MRVTKESPGGGSLCQDSQHSGIFLQAALPAGVYLPEYRLLALLRWNSGVKTWYA